MLSIISSQINLTYLININLFFKYKNNESKSEELIKLFLKSFNQVQLVNIFVAYHFKILL